MPPNPENTSEEVRTDDLILQKIGDLQRLIEMALVKVGEKVEHKQEDLDQMREQFNTLIDDLKKKYSVAEVAAHEAEANPHPQYMKNGARSFGITIDGGGSVITTGFKGFVTIPFNATITRWDLFADVAGDIVIDVWKDTYANFPPAVADTITGTEKPTLSGVQKNQDAALSSWSTSVTAGDVVGFGGIYMGNLVLPLEADVELGVQYGANGTEFTGSFAGGGSEHSYTFVS